jgi:hypothetical protein
MVFLGITKEYKFSSEGVEENKTIEEALKNQNKSPYRNERAANYRLNRKGFP